jgi:nucleoside phosphorylase
MTSDDEAMLDAWLRMADHEVGATVAAALHIEGVLDQVKRRATSTRVLLGIDTITPVGDSVRQWSTLNTLFTEALYSAGIAPDDVMGYERTSDGVRYALLISHLGTIADLASRLDQLAAHRNRRQQPPLRLKIAVELGGDFSMLDRLFDTPLIDRAFEANRSHSELIMSDQAFRAVCQGDGRTSFRQDEFVRADRAWVRVPSVDIDALAVEQSHTARPVQVTNAVTGYAENVIQADVVYDRADPAEKIARRAENTSAGVEVKETPRWEPTVGLITAIPEEFIAMRYLLENGAERYVSGDSTRYVVGTLPGLQGRPHTVALTMQGAPGADGAADGCANLLRSFSSISAVIMVGTAVGVPNVTRPEQHVRLGDIVVATGGVVDYDDVHVGADGAELRPGFPLPSQRLVRCATILRSEERRGLRPWEQWLDVISRPALSGYTRPNERTDVVYSSSGHLLDHPRRDQSGHRRGLPKVHYGLIGTVDRSPRDVAARIQAAAPHRLLAIEMEGSTIGVSSALNGREWLVVRGVSDYGDSQRMTMWRRYASLAAAAYVRSLLATCVPLGSAGMAGGERSRLTRLVSRPAARRV